MLTPHTHLSREREHFHLVSPMTTRGPRESGGLGPPAIADREQMLQAQMPSTHKSAAPWDWNTDQHENHKSMVDVGKYASAMEHLWD